MENVKDVAIIGGGLAGLTAANLLAKKNFDVILIETKKYPFHKVCGEYVSNETRDFLLQKNLFPSVLKPAEITRLVLSSPMGKCVGADLDLAGFGISRFAFDEFLYKRALENGSGFELGKKAISVKFLNDIFEIKLSDGKVIHSKIVIGSFGKRSNLDKELNRDFLKKRSPYIGVKYHIKNKEFARNTIALHNFENGYCGINAIENDKLCLCYLSARSNLKKNGSIEAMEKEVLYKNPLLKNVFQNSEFLYEKPEVINEISFEKKEAVQNHILMCGDAAGMIAPLCGNGMAMAIHSAKILSEEIEAFFTHKSRRKLEQDYSEKWNLHFSKRLWFGRQVQGLFGRPFLSELAVGACKVSKPVLNLIIKQTHGKAF